MSNLIVFARLLSVTFVYTAWYMRIHNTHKQSNIFCRVTQ